MPYRTPAVAVTFGRTVRLRGDQPITSAGTVVANNGVPTGCSEAVAYHCVADGPPFTGKTPLQITLRHLSDEPPPLPADVPPELRRLITRAMNKVPAHRYPTAALTSL